MATFTDNVSYTTRLSITPTPNEVLVSTNTIPYKGFCTKILCISELRRFTIEPAIYQDSFST